MLMRNNLSYLKEDYPCQMLMLCCSGFHEYNIESHDAMVKLMEECFRNGSTEEDESKPHIIHGEDKHSISEESEEIESTTDECFNFCYYDWKCNNNYDVDGLMILFVILQYY